MSVPVVRLGDVCTRVSDGTHQAPNWADDGIPFLFVSNIRNGRISFETNKFVSDEEYRKLTKNCPIEAGDVLYTAVGSYGNSAVVPNDRKFIFQRHVAHLKPRHELIDSTYLAQMLETPAVRRQADKLARGVAQKTVTLTSLRDFEIPLPPLDEQKRIAAILDKADALRRQRRQALALLDSLTQSIFLEMFGDPVSNPKGWNVSPLGAVADFMSGGTPSKASPSYWVGQIPWVSPKDMKSIIVRDSIDHISEKAVQNSAVKLAPADAILLVVRGMILAHTVPIGILARPAAFNQDIKAILFGRSVSARFGLWNILVQSASILQKVSTAAHGTKRLDMESVMDLPVLCPPTFLQNEFIEKCVRVERLIINSNKLSEEGHSVFVSIQDSVFGKRATSA